MNSDKIIRFFSTLKQTNALFSRKRDSMFYIKTIQQNQTPSLKSIYRKYIKQSLRFYKTGNQYIGEYLFRLLQAKKQNLKEGRKNLIEINELLDQIKTINAKQQLLQKNSHEIKPNPLFSKLKTNSQSMESHEIRLNLQKQTQQRILTEKMLDEFQCLHNLSKLLQDSMNVKSEMDLRTKQQSKLVRLSFNMSQFFTSSLSIRQGYESLALMERLEDDMEYEVLSYKDKEFVRDVLVKICGPKKLNHLRYRSVIDYLKDTNAINNELKIGRTEISRTAKKSLQKKNEKKQMDEKEYLNEAIQQNEDQQQQQEQLTQKEWKLISMEYRNQEVRKILNQRKQSTQTDKQSTKNIKLSKQLKKSLIFQILYKSQRIHQLLKPNEKLQQEIYQLIKRLFKLTNESTNNTENKMKYRLLEDVIIQNQFIDEFINEKKIIIV